MNQKLALSVLGKIMDWTDDRARREFNWLNLMARLKYDGYRDFQAGVRFAESLATWLQQFEPNERETAYSFVRRTLVYIGPSEMERLVEQFYPRAVVDRLFRTVAAECSIALHRVLVDENARLATERLRRQTLFMGLSDGARIDAVRHKNVGLITNEQIVQGTQVDPEKWKDLLAKLRRDLGDSTARFRLVFLVDDFTATGTSLLRDSDNDKWKGKLPRFIESVRGANEALCEDRPLADGWELCIHHYVASSAAVVAIKERLERMDAVPEGWAHATRPSYGMTLPAKLPIDQSPGRDEDFLKLTEAYYDPIIQTEHTNVGGVTHLGLGYGGCALPLVLEHNTPNNAIALLWAETDGSGAGDRRHPAMRPLFRRRQRHT